MPVNPVQLNACSNGRREGTMWTRCVYGDYACYLSLVSRQLFAVIFIIASAGHFNSSAIGSAAQHGVPMPCLLVPLSGFIGPAGGLRLRFGSYPTLGRRELGAWLDLV